MKAIPNKLFFAWVEEEIADGRSVRIPLKGHSMYPLLRNERDQVVLAPCSAGEIRKMDVVLFRYRGIHVLHRVIRREGDRLWLQGDGVCVSHETCTTSDVVAILQRVVRPSGREWEVKGWRWRIASGLWRGVGPLRPLLLRLLSHYILER